MTRPTFAGVSSTSHREVRISGRSPPGRGARTAARRLGDDDSRHGSHARLPPDRPDLDRRSTAAARPLEPTRPVRRRRARPAPLGRAEAVRVERVHLADRVAAARTGSNAPPQTQSALRARALERRVPRPERALQALCAARARAQRADAVARARARVRSAAGRAASLVGQPRGHAHARDSPRLRRRRGRGQAGKAAAVGPRRALVSAEPDDVRAGGRPSARGAALSCARRAADEGGLGGASGGRGRARARASDLSLPLRPAHPRSRPRRGAVRLPLPPRDVRAQGEARVRLLRAADPRRRPARRAHRAAFRSQDEDARGSRCVG